MTAPTHTPAYTLTDSATMLRRDMRHMLRYPIMTISGIVTPTLFLLLFRFVFGGAIGAPGGGSYVNYIVPGILVMAVGSGGAATSINVNTDMTEGVIARLRTMAVSRTSILTGQVIGSLIRTLMSLAVLVAVSFLIGFRPATGVAGWFGVVGLLALLTFAFTWLTVGVGLSAKTQAGANSGALPLMFLPFISSAFVDPSTMSTGIRWFAEYQSFTPIIDTVRALLAGAAVGDDGIVAVIWCVAPTVVGVLWSRAAFDRLPNR
jgi:ABC-2 type transport system permease protein